jgi:hypothetical protein
MIVLSPLIGQASGRLGDLVFVRGPRGGYVRAWVAPTEVATTERQAVWDAMSDVAPQWSTLSTANKAAWNLYSVAHPRPNRLGQKHPIGGYQEYTRANLTASQANALLGSAFSLITAPPTVWRASPVVVPGITYTTATGIALIDLGAAAGYSTSAQAFVALWVSEPQPRTRLAYYGAWTLIKASTQPGTTTTWTATVPVGHRPVSGQALFLRSRYRDELGNLHAPILQRIIAP